MWDLKNSKISNTYGRLVQIIGDKFYDGNGNLLSNVLVIDGVDGLNGRDGADGLNGRDGADGLNGRDGADGLNGRDGVDGLNGRDGVDGLNGRDGHVGRDGAPGKDGITTVINIPANTDSLQDQIDNLFNAFNILNNSIQTDTSSDEINALKQAINALKQQVNTLKIDLVASNARIDINRQDLQDFKDDIARRSQTQPTRKITRVAEVTTIEMDLMNSFRNKVDASNALNQFRNKQGKNFKNCR